MVQLAPLTCGVGGGGARVRFYTLDNDDLGIKVHALRTVLNLLSTAVDKKIPNRAQPTVLTA